MTVGEEWSGGGIYLGDVKLISRGADMRWWRLVGLVVFSSASLLVQAGTQNDEDCWRLWK